MIVPAFSLSGEVAVSVPSALVLTFTFRLMVSCAGKSVELPDCPVRVVSGELGASVLLTVPRRGELPCEKNSIASRSAWHGAYVWPTTRNVPWPLLVALSGGVTTVRTFWPLTKVQVTIEPIGGRSGQGWANVSFDVKNADTAIAERRRVLRMRMVRSRMENGVETLRTFRKLQCGQSQFVVSGETEENYHGGGWKTSSTLLYIA